MVCAVAMGTVNTLVSGRAKKCFVVVRLVWFARTALALANECD